MLKFSVFGSSREGDDVADIGHTRNEEEQSLEAKAEATVRNSSVAACVDVPLEVLAAHSELVDAGFEFLERCLTLTASDDFANLREEYVHSADGAAVFVLLHIEGLDILGEVNQDNRLAEVSLD